MLKQKLCMSQKTQLRQMQKTITLSNIKIYIKKEIIYLTNIKYLDQMIQKMIDRLSQIRQITLLKLRQKYQYSLISQKQKKIIKFIQEKQNNKNNQINCKFMWQYFKEQFNYQETKQNQQLNNLNKNKEKIDKISKQFQKQIIEFSKKINKSLNLHLNQYFQTRIKDLYIDNHGWIRVMMKKDNIITTDFKGGLIPQDIDKMKIVDMGWSDNPQTMYTPQSWYLNNVKFGLHIINLPINQVIANVFNGITPTGQEWTQNYQSGFLVYRGIVQTYGHFNSFYMGRDWKQHYIIGNQISLETGGVANHTGQWIHSSTNGYAQKQHSITSRIGWKNTRVFWIRVQ